MVLVQPGAVYASQTLKFAAPVYVGDEVVARVQALNIRTTGAANGGAASRYVYAPLQQALLTSLPYY